MGAGLSLVVAPLTTAMMGSLPAKHAGVGSAINNALSRVGPQLAGAVIFIAISSVFFSNLASALPGLDTSNAQVRTRVSAMNVASSSSSAVAAHGAPGHADPQVQAAVASSSIDAFRVAMLACAALLLLAAAINYAGLARRDEPAPTDADQSSDGTG